MLTAREWIEKGEQLFDEPRYEEAREAFQSAIDLDDSLSEAWRKRGICRWFLNEGAGRALRDCLEAIRRDPNNAEAWRNVGFYRTDLGPFVRAVEAFDRAIELAPEDAAAHYHRGNALVKLSRTT